MALTVEQVQKAVPAGLKKAVTPAFVNKINNVVQDPVVAKQVRENFLSYSKVLQDGRFKVEDYLRAVMYVSFKLMGLSNQDAYIRTFPQRYQQLMAKGADPSTLAAYVSMYNKGKLVNLILEQTLVPTWVLNAETYQKAINVQADLMANAKSELVRMQAANSILTHLKKPEAVGPLVNIDMRENSGVNELKETLRQLAQQQQALIQQGVPTKQIAAQAIVTVEPVEPGVAE